VLQKSVKDPVGYSLPALPETALGPFVLLSRLHQLAVYLHGFNSVLSRLSLLFESLLHPELSKQRVTACVNMLNFLSGECVQQVSEEERRRKSKCVANSQTVNEQLGGCKVIYD
jgi:hypothetical protein